MNFIGDEGRSLGAERQAQAPNNKELRAPKVQVVSVLEKARTTCHVRTREASASEPLTTHRNIKDDIKTKPVRVVWDKTEANLFADPSVSGVEKARI